MPRAGMKGLPRMSDKKDYWHNEGEKDASEGNRFSPPVCSFWTANESKAEDHDAYVKGWENTKDQLAGKKQAEETGSIAR